MAKQYICNKCGNPFDMWDKQEAFHIYRQLGYGTKYDGSELELDLCCKCLEKLVEECKISPVIEKDNNEIIHNQDN